MGRIRRAAKKLSESDYTLYTTAMAGSQFGDVLMHAENLRKFKKSTSVNATSSESHALHSATPGEDSEADMH